jgi:hypothetical protein
MRGYSTAIPYISSTLSSGCRSVLFQSSSSSTLLGFLFDNVTHHRAAEVDVKYEVDADGGSGATYCSRKPLCGGWYGKRRGLVRHELK